MCNLGSIIKRKGNLDDGVLFPKPTNDFMSLFRKRCSKTDAVSSENVIVIVQMLLRKCYCAKCLYILFNYVTFAYLNMGCRFQKNNIFRLFLLWYFNDTYNSEQIVIPETYKTNLYSKQETKVNICIPFGLAMRPNNCLPSP